MKFYKYTYTDLSLFLGMPVELHILIFTLHLASLTKNIPDNTEFFIGLE